MDFKNVDIIHQHIKNQIDQEAENLQSDYTFSPIAKEKIQQTESRLGFEFPKSYKIFLEKLWMPEFSDWTKFVDLDNIEICQNCWDMSWMVVFAKNISDNIFLFWKNSHSQEYDIFLWDPETWRCIKISDDFESWLNKQIDLIADPEQYQDHDFSLANNELEKLEKCNNCNLEGLKKFVSDI